MSNNVVWCQVIDGKVMSVAQNRQGLPGEQELPDDHPDVQAYLNPPITPLKSIGSLEQQNPITHRALREFFIGFGEVNEAFKATLLYQRAKAVDDAIKLERAKL